jgi:DNA-binding Lrp family transcriptional regulator
MSWLDELSELERKAVTRLQELEPYVAEYRELEQVVQRLGVTREATAASPSPPAPPVTPKPKRTTAPASRRSSSRASSARPGERERQLMRIVAERPGITVPEIAAELKVDPTGLYGIVRRLLKQGRLRKDGMQLREAVLSGGQAPAPGRRWQAEA